MDFPFDALRRAPDVEGQGLVASDAADRLLLDESLDARTLSGPGELVIIGDGYGALTLACAHAGARDIRVHQDPLTGEQALARNAATLGLTDAYTSLPLSGSLVQDASLVLLRLPRSLEELDDIAGLIAAYAASDVVVYAGGRIKHMTVAMNDVLRRHFGRVDVTHARQKSRVLIASDPQNGADPQPRKALVDGITVCALGGVFAGPTIDIGTRMLLAALPEALPSDGPLIDYACGTGVVATALALRYPGRTVHASDQSAAAVESARATVAANHVDDRVRVVRDDLLLSLPDASAAFIALNPPFHSGAAVTDALAPRMFEDAARVLREGGELWTVWNSHLRYRPVLERLVGPTRQVARDAKFTVTASVRRG